MRHSSVVADIADKAGKTSSSARQPRSGAGHWKSTAGRAERRWIDGQLATNRHRGKGEAPAVNRRAHHISDHLEGKQD